MKWFAVRSASIVAAIAGCILLQVGAKAFLGDYNQLLLMLIGIFVTLAVSLNLINGITGQFSIGHAAFFQVGAYTAGVLASYYFPKFAASQPIAWLILSAVFGGLIAGLAGFVVGLPSLRLRGDYLAVVTLGIGEIVTILVKNQKSLGEAYGLSVKPQIQSIAIIWLLAVLCIAVCRNLIKTSHGLSFLAVREDEIASAAMGVNITKVKVTAFVIGSAFAGAAGALYAHSKAFIGPSDFSMDVSFLILTMVVLGGTGSITGSAIAAALLFYIPEKMRELPNMPIAVPIAVLVGLFCAVYLLKKIQDTFHGPFGARLARNIGAVVVGVVVSIIGSKLLGSIAPLKAEVLGANMRMPVLALTLVVLMLLRPQGIFGHKEFSPNLFFKRKEAA